jgi:adenosylcobinamide kinase/adenosylcobinamide-phosphate guanylyltransferase
MKNLTLVTGGARSGKSKLAESLALECDLPITYIATLQRWSDDPESIKRIERHRARRPSDWVTVERSFELAGYIKQISQGSACIVLDCLSLYVSNILLEDFDQSGDPYQREPVVVNQCKQLLEGIRERRDLNFIVVTNEVGGGVVPENKLARAYRDMLGEMNQLFAGQADVVWLSVCGLRVCIKP